jgi:hypothetical protein
MLKEGRGGETAEQAVGPSLLHLTVSTGRVRRSRRSEVHDEIVSALRPLVETGGGPIPGCAGYDVAITRNGRDVLFTVTQAGFPVVTCGLAVKDAASVWRALLALMPAAGKVEPPAEMPWLVVAFHEGAPNPDLYWIADFERCLAWALIETPERPASVAAWNAQKNRTAAEWAGAQKFCAQWPEGL